MGFLVNLPGVRRGAERYDIVGPGACERAGLIIIRVAVRLRARALEHLRVLRRLACGRCAVRALAAVLLVAERLARALARHALPAGTRHAQLRRARPVQIRHTLHLRAVGAGAALRHHQHRQVVAVDEAEVVKVLPGVAVESELSQRGGGRGAASSTFQLPGAAIACYAGEFAGGVFGAVCPPPKPTSPRRRRIDDFRFAGL